MSKNQGNKNQGKPGTQTTQVTPSVQPQPGSTADAMVLVQDNVPDYLKKAATGEGRGSENVGQDDLVIPRLELIQALSPAVDENDGGYIQGAKQGMLCNSVTRQLYGNEVFVVPVSFNKQWLVWRDRKKGGGFLGSFPDAEAAAAKVKAEGGEEKGISAMDTPTHFALLVNRETGGVDEVMIPMPRTKAKVSRQWNSMIRMAGGDRFSRVYRISSMQDENNNGEKFYNFVVAPSGFPSKVLFDRAEKVYTQIDAGERRVVMDVSDLDNGGTPAGVDGEGSEM